VNIHLDQPLPVGSSSYLQARASSLKTPDRAPQRGGAVMPCSRWGLPSHRHHWRCWCALNAPFHPYLVAPTWAEAQAEAQGGLLSVALARGFPRVAVSNHRALWSPDFPRRGLLRL